MSSMFFSIVKNSIFRSKTQKLLAFITIFLSTALVACMLNITLKIGDQIATELRSYGSNIVVLPKSNSLSIEINGKDYSPLKNQDYLAESDLHTVKEIFWRNNIVALAPFLYGETNTTDGRNFKLVGTYFKKNLHISDEPEYSSGIKDLYSYWIINGKYPQDDSMNEVVIGSKLAEAQHIKIGDKLVFDKYPVIVTGILSGAGDNEQKVIMSLKLAQAILKKSNLINKVEVSAMTIPENDLSMKARKDIDSLDSLQYDNWYCSAYVGSIAFQITEQFPGAIAKGVLSVSEGQSNIVKKIQGLMGLVSIIALIVSCIGIVSLMSSEIYNRKKEIGLLKAIGASSFSIFLCFITETLVVGIISGFCGALFGYLLSILISYQIFGSFVGISIMVLPLSIAFAILICIIGSILPLRSVTKLLPAEVLYGRK